MKVVILAAFITLSSALPSTTDHWSLFKVQHGKSYSSPSEEQYRRSIFMDNLKVIEKHNAKYAAGLVSYSMRVNKFADKLPEELSSQLNGFTMQHQAERKSADFNNMLPANKDLPASVDWRKEGAVTDVKYQEHCGSCWAFSATGSMEGQLFRKTGKLVSLSEQQLVDCSKGYKNMGCSGGLMDNAFVYIKHVGGLETEDSYPYLGEEGHCRFELENVAKGTAIKSYVDLPAGDEEALKTAVATVGPISVAVSAGNVPFLFYNTGVFDGEGCISSELNHGVLIVGYGSENGEDYWIVKNSWSSGWGENGYMKLARNKGNVCGIASMASYPVL